MSRVDIKIIAGNDTENPLFASSRHLQGLSRKWDELLNTAETDENGNKNIIYIPQIPQHIIENIIKYINITFMDPNPQGISMCDENIQEYFSAGQFLEMEEIQKFCLDYLKARESTLENTSFLFKLIGVSENSNVDKIVTLKIREFFIENAHQLDLIVKKCKSEGVSEDAVLKLLVDWLNFRSDSNGMNLDLDLDLNKLLQEFSSTENKFKVLETFHQIGDLQGKNKAFSLLMNLTQNLNSNHQVQNGDSASENEPESRMSTATARASAASVQESKSPSPVPSPSSSLSDLSDNSNHEENMESASSEDEDEDFGTGDLVDIFPNSLEVQMNMLKKHEQFPSITVVNECFFESEALRQKFRFISPLPSCTENQRKNWLCDPHSDCTNKFNLTEIDQPPVFIKKSNISGIGLFAKRQLLEGQVLCCYAGKITETCTDLIYAMGIYDGNKKKYIIDASEFGNWGRFANGELNATPNVEFEGVAGSSKVMVVLTAVKEIAPGEEIIAKYGDKYWENQKKDRINDEESDSLEFESLSPRPFKRKQTARKRCFGLWWRPSP